MVCQFGIEHAADAAFFAHPFAHQKEWWDIRDPAWSLIYQYRVPSEAVNGPAADDSRNDAEFDVQAWLAEGRANADKLPAGVVLPEPTDWADKLVKEWLETPPCEARGLADILRTHCQPREVSNG
jgi:hypothetical protein